MARRWWVIVPIVAIGWGAAIAWQSWQSSNDPWTKVAKTKSTPGSGSSDGEKRAAETGDAGRPVDFTDLVVTRNALYDTVWANEKLSQAYEETFVALWDSLRAANDKFAVLAELPFEELRLGHPGERTTLDWGILRAKCDHQPFTFKRWELRQFLDRLASQGWRLVQSQWRHATFEAALGDRPARSTFDFVLHTENNIQPQRQQRVIVKGTLRVEWKSELARDGMYEPKTLDAVGVDIFTRVGPPAFVELAATREVLAPRAGWQGIDMAEPVLAADLTGDGLSEILMCGRAIALQYDKDEGAFKPSLISSKIRRMSSAAILADLTGDGIGDLAFITPADEPGEAATLVALPGDDGGRFEQEPIECWKGICEYPTALTAGDVDGDGDLDLFLGQYKAPHVDGQMPTPYFDANDGYPAYLLINDGQSRFADRTAEAGLDKKRNRRTQGASLVDLDEDGKLDLIVTSDFAGIDVYRNDGTGKFVDVTDAWLEDRHGFGMSHTLADYDLDGKLDVFAVGTSSVTPRRLDAMKLGREGHESLQAMRGRMSYGNRMFLARGGKYAQPAWKDQVAQTGWPSGSTSFDFDNDGDRDVYVANGRQSGRSARDYSTHFWTQDIYTGSSNPDPEIAKLFEVCLAELHGGDISWNGYEHNALLMNLGGKGFVDVAFLLGFAFEFDARSVLSDDFDGDGRMDLAVVENRMPQRGLTRQTLHLLANRFDPPGAKRHWIGVRLQGAAGVSPIGAAVTLTSAKGTQPARVVTGDSLNCQHAPLVHFGLGEAADVTAIEIRWPNGMVTKLERPQVDRYHVVAPTP
jgi:enediyne biosynthesis protein E4